MLIILLSWIFITILVYPVGVLLHSLLKRLFRLEVVDEHFAVHCISGLLVGYFVSTLLCLFLPLGLISNVLMAGLACAGVVISRQELKAAVLSDGNRLRKGNWIISLLCLFFILIFSYLSYLPSSHYDDGLYYSTTIKWLQEYGTVKGLANVNPAIGYNSSWHILQANFGFRYLHSGLFNDLNGLLVAWMLVYSTGGINNLIKGDNSLQNCVRALIIIPVLLFHFGATSDVILFNVNFLGSPTADLPACLITWLIFLLFIRKPNTNDPRMHLADILVILYTTWALSIKLSSMPIILLGIFIVARSVLARRFRGPLLITALSLVVILPWLIRNIYISGYLLFPFSSIDIFQVPWKLPAADVQWLEKAVRTWAMGADLNGSVDIPFFKWFPGWFNNINFIQQVILGVVMVATGTYTLIALWHILFRRAGIFRSHIREIICVVTCFTGILFWLYKAPDFRFGYGFLCFYCIYFITFTSHYFLEDNLHFLYWPIALYMAAVVYFYYNDKWMSARVIFGKPLEYRMPSKMKQVPLAGNLHMNIVSQEGSWNAPLPAANDYEFNVFHPMPLGRSLKAGFMANKNGK